MNKEGSFKRHKSHQNMGESIPIKKESGSDELDVDEKVVNKAPIEKSHGCRSFKKPTSSKSSNNPANNSADRPTRNPTNNPTNNRTNTAQRSIPPTC